MLDRIREMLAEQNIFLCGAISLADCSVRKPYLLDRVDIGLDGSAVIFAIPYHTPACEDPCRNISRYAVSRDYHLFTKELSDALLPRLQKEFPHNRFAFFSDQSPIDEREAAVKCGLGVMGRNGLLITKPYSSYVFLGEIITDATCRRMPPQDKLATCRNCGACLAACPMHPSKTEQCLSALTQKKGTLTDRETEAIRATRTVWGCDICQEVCPHTAEALRLGTITTPIPFFHHAPLPRLTYQAVADMAEDTFSNRAYAWRGKAVILRNLAVGEEEHGEAEKNKG